MGKNRVITIGRQFGSGGRAIGEQLAKELGIPFYDKEILLHASEQSGLHIGLFERNDEKKTSSLLYTLATNSYFYGPSMSSAEHAIGTQLYVAQVNAIKSLAEQGDCVMVGRCADYFLKNHCNLVSVFITADMPCRIERIMTRYNLTEKNAQDMIKKIDKSRSSYYNSTTGDKWGDARIYDLCLNSSKLGLDGSVKLIRAFLDSNEAYKKES